MKAVPGLFLLLLLSTPLRAEETGRFTVFAGGREAGWEVFTVGPRGELESRAELRRGGREQILSLTLVLDERGELVRFAARGSQGEKERMVTLARQDGALVGEERQGESGEPLRLDPDPGALVLAEPFAAPWIYVARAYDRARGGAQTFPAVFPIEAATGIVTVTMREEEPLEIDGRAVLALRLFAKPSHGDPANLWITETGRLVVCARSVAGLSAVRGTEVRIGLKPGQDPPDPEGAFSQRVRFATEGGTLAGTFLRPKNGRERHPAALLLSGSGPQDRNGNAPGAELQWNYLHSFASALAERGIASLRYDERGVGRSGGSFSDASLTDLVSDAGSALTYLRSREDVDPARIFIVGHSEGALIGALLATEDRLRGLVTLGAPARPLDRVLLAQVRRRLTVRERPPREVQRMLGEMRAYFEHVRLSEGSLVEWKGRLREVAWLKQHLDLDIEQVFAGVDCPVLAVHGERDGQVEASDAARVRKLLVGSPSVEVAILAGLDHFLIPTSGEIADYGDARRRVAAAALNKVADWVETRTR